MRCELGEPMEFHAPEMGFSENHQPEFRFTHAQRDAIKERDGNKCQAPVPHHCGGNLNVHHIFGQRYCYELKINPDFPENGITLCENFHQKVIHPDSSIAMKCLDEQTAMRVVEERRIELMADRIIYWNDEFDRVLMMTAVKNTQRATAKGWHFPSKSEAPDEKPRTHI